MNRLPTLIIFSVIFCSCHGHPTSDLAIYRACDEGFDESNRVLQFNSQSGYNTLQRNASDSRNYDRDKMWLEIAMNIKAVSDTMVKYIIRTQNALIDDAGPNYEGKTISYNQGNERAVRHVIYQHEQGKALYSRLIQFKEKLLGVDSNIAHQFKDRLNPFTRDFDTIKNGQSDFNDHYFKNTPAIGAVVVLKKFENNIRIIENDLVNYCLNNTYGIHESFGESFQYIIGQSSTIVEPGQTIEITAGIGAYSTAAQPKVWVNGKAINTNDDGVAVYKFRSAASPGKFKVPVTINFTKPDGTKETVKQSIEYTVAEMQKKE